MYAHFSTFFVTVFRYICIFHEDKLFKYGWNPKLLARVCVAVHIFVSIASSIGVLAGSPDNRSLSACIGTYETHFQEKNGNLVCSRGGFYREAFCKLCVAFHTILSSNIPEAILLFFCFKAIQQQTEKSKALISENSFQSRKRDNGIVISISIIQWGIELIHTVSYYLYVYYLHGISNYADKIFSVYLIVFHMIIQPSFYLNGDAEFRRNLSNNGLFSALKTAILAKERF